MLLFLLLNDEEKSKFLRVHDKYAGFLYRVCLKTLKDSSLAEEATQISYEKIMKNLDHIDDVSSKETQSYVYMIAYNTAINLIKAEKKYVTKPEEDLFYIEADELSAEEQIARAETNEELHRAMARLSEHERMMLAMKYGREYSYWEIAEQFDMKEAGVRKKMERIRGKLAVFLKEEQGGMREKV